MTVFLRFRALRKQCKANKRWMDFILEASSPSQEISGYIIFLSTHVKKFQWISEDLRNCLKGKSCFHIKKLSADLEKEIAEMIEVGREIYESEDLI